MQRPLRDSKDLAAALPCLPLFPLPQTVLFPGALLPLHVFEPRYRKMVRNVLETHRVLSVVLIRDARALDQHGHPEIAQIAGVGKILDHVEMPDGRYNILLQGCARVRLDEQPFVSLYRTATGTLLEDEPSEVSRRDHAALLATVTSFVTMVRQREPSFDFELPRNASAGLTADLCAHHLLLNCRERQGVLETLEVAARVRRVTESLALQQLALSAQGSDVN